MSEAASGHKVVVHTLDNEVVYGFCSEENVSSPFRIVTREGLKKEFDRKDLKAVFFVKDFEGNPDYDEELHLDREGASKVVWVQVQFLDGEIHEGRIKNHLELIQDSGFYLWPTDSDTNNERVYVLKSALKDFVILAPV